MLDLRKVMASPGSSISFEISLDLSDMRFGSGCPAAEPVAAHGTVRNTADVLELSGEIATKIQNEMTYPGQVKITVIREVRSVAYAK